MKTITTTRLSTEVCTPWRMESAPSDGPTVRSSRYLIDAQRAGAESQRQIVSRFLAEIAGNLAAILNLALDGGRGNNPVIQNDGHLAANILLSEGPEALGGFRREREIHLPEARIRVVAILHCAAQVAAVNGSGAAQDIPGFAGIDSTRGAARLRAAGDEVRAWRQNPAVTA